MRNAIALIFLSLTTLVFANNSQTPNAVDNYPELDTPTFYKYEIIRDVVQDRRSDWTNVVGIARQIPLSQAMKIADTYPEIAYFFYTKGIGMVLEAQTGELRFFKHGDTVFFHGEPCWDKAYDLSDGYIKRDHNPIP